MIRVRVTAARTAQPPARRSSRYNLQLTVAAGLELAATHYRFPMKASAAALLAFATVTTAQTPSLSPAQKAITAARAQIQKDPKSAQSYNDLARALVRRGRETGNPDYYRQAELAVQNSLRVEPDNFEGYKARVTVLLGLHDDAAALELAQKLNKHIPDDVLVRGLIADACMELGDYEQAENQAQWMLNLRRGNIPGMIRGAFLRTAFGDVEGALDWLTSAFKLTGFSEVEDRAWLATHIARLRLQTGKLELADQILQQALEIFPDYYFALDALAETRSAQGKHGEAVDLLHRAQKMAPHPRRLFSLAVALSLAGRAPEAKIAFAEFELRAREISDKPDNANRELISYYTDYAHKPAEALRVARAETATRHDIHTLDAYAWALYANGQYEEARAELDKALKVGIHNATLFGHAAAIAEKLQDQTAAGNFERRARELRP
jgi:tetratricopeptide (TPR) repeat protein